jgi:hypothetical protein
VVPPLARRRPAILVAALALGLTALAGGATSAPAGDPTIAGCPVFPADNPWNQDVSALPVAADSDQMVAAIGLDAPLHPDFSDHGRYGIPYNVVSRRTPRTRIRRWEYPAESNRVSYPIPPRPRIEAGSDAHMILLDRSACRLFELFAAHRVAGGWEAGSGAVWSLRSDALRPDGWTSADAAGLPILPGLARAGEVERGVIHHALRFTAPRTGSAHVYPARHDAGSGSGLPPMGLRVRLKASVSLAGFGPQARVVLTALKRYGMILADNGSPWYIGGAPSAGWDDDDLHALGRITGRDFEVVDASSLPRP